VIKNNKRLLNDHVQSTELDQAVTLQSVSDYAAQPSLLREFTPTCQSKQKTSNCVMVLSFKPQVVSRHMQKRAAREVSGVRNDCIVVYGLFDATTPVLSHRRFRTTCSAWTPRCTWSTASPCTGSGS
jgi:hypothetical protein